MHVNPQMHTIYRDIYSLQNVFKVLVFSQLSWSVVTMFGFVFSFLCFLAILNLLERQICFLFLTIIVYTDDFPQ